MTGDEADAILRWLVEPDESRGISFFEPPEWRRWTYADLATAAGSYAARLVESGVRPGDVVALGVPTGPAFVWTYFATLLAGATPATLPLPSFVPAREQYLDRIAELLRLAGPRVVVSELEASETLGEACHRAALDAPPVVLHSSVPDSTDPLAPTRNPGASAMLQFTSGTSGGARAVELSFANLDGNTAAIARWLEMAPSDVTASWLPLYHDMGLIGCLLTPIRVQSDVMLMRPEQFLRSPRAWLECFGVSGATLTAAPNFVLRVLLRAVARLEIRVGDWDLSRWRAFILGAERIDARAMAQVAAALAPHGFSPTAFLPAYGLAEATLAVTGKCLTDPNRAIRVQLGTDQLGHGHDMVLAEIATDAGRFQSDDWLVGCGRPVDGADVHILDDTGEFLADGRIGEVAVGGRSVAAGVRPAPARREPLLRTGDAGFVVDGDLYVVGRIDDCLLVEGVRFYVEAVEAALTKLPGAPVGRFCCFADPGGAPTLVLLAEQERGSWLEDAASWLERALTGADIRVVRGRTGAILRTTSGKPRRREMWARWTEGAPTRAATVSEP